MEKLAENGAVPTKTYSAYSLGRRSPFLWLAVLLASLALAARIAYYSPAGEGAEGLSSPLFVPVFIVLPALCCFFFSWDIILHGESRLYKASRPVLFFCIFSVLRAVWLKSSGVIAPLQLAALILGYLIVCVFFRLAVNTGGLRLKIGLRKGIAVCALSAAFVLRLAFSLLPALKAGELDAIFIAASPALFSLSALVVLLFARRKESERPLPMAGDRKDGRRLRSLDPLNGVAVYIMPDRTGANNLFSDSFECSRTEEYIREKREQGMEHFGYTHLFLATYARTVAKYPAVNRFISGQRTYSRGHEIEISMAVKKDMSIDSAETIITVYLDPKDTVADVYEKLNHEVASVKKTSELDSSFDRLAGFLNFIPGVLMKLTIWLLKTADYFGLLPKQLTRLSPFHGSMFITSMGSLGIRPIFHHLYDFGNIPVFVAFGIKRRENEILQDGTCVQKRYIDFTVNTDERICDGFYFASAFKYFKRVIADPAKLDDPPERIVEDVE